MSITYSQQPTANSIQASDNPIVFVFSGSNSTQPNFSFIVETIINGVVVSTDMVFPERGSKAHFDIRKTTIAEFFAAARSLVLYELADFSTAKIRVAERYGSTPTLYGFYDSNIFKIMKACCDDDTFQQDWITLNYPASLKWLTDVPGNAYTVSRNSASWFSILNTDATVTVTISLYGATGNLIYTQVDSPVTGKDKISFNISELTLFPILILASCSLSDVYSVEIKFNSSDSIYIHYVSTECELDQQISWLNKLGTYDQMIFSHNREVQHSIQSQEYKKQFGNWSASNSFEYDPLTTGDIPYLKIIEQSGSLHTGWISEQYQNWLKGITESIDVLLITGDIKEKILVTDTKSETLKIKYEEILNFQVNYKKTNFKSITQ